ncbi:hypothetical protein SapgrDRAFT_1092 [Saprospira grandis DSM 2844]|uniref:GmrSD restriction endonucleases N-terminal domain-containing protein n=1 Tax=Saprospira grandis DSM 2844 TaxID=694433 RepID=J0P5U2_9BACT|nr:DUF262 domain-containing protein [Saprospira grandis]EJF52817.1 hypothetical protein SapgrDRAFT_1092 [Saprospira grandis DSM 2844]
MANLSAESKSLNEVFGLTYKYVIPAYQRDYQWDYDRCYTLYNDLIEAYYKSKDDSEAPNYFIGNIVLSKDKSHKGLYRIIDGQQRMTTILLMVKSIYVLDQELEGLKDFYLVNAGGLKKNKKAPRFTYEANQNQSLLYDVLESNATDFKARYEECIDGSKNSRERTNNLEQRCTNIFEKNCFLFYSWFSFLKEEKKEDLSEVTNFIVDQVILLPIYVDDKDAEDAEQSAITIFETINNRGMSLRDADIFHAKLYEKAKKIGEEDDYMARWENLKQDCEELDITIDDLFRYYSQVIRGKANNFGSETGLRDFFIKTKNSPLYKTPYSETVDALEKIVQIIFALNKATTLADSSITPWLQIIGEYSNKYPQNAIVVYCYTYDLKDSKTMSDNENFKLFLQELIRRVFRYGPSSSVKREIYKIVATIANGKKLDYYSGGTLEKEELLYQGKFSKTWALLAYYLNSNNSLVLEYKLESIIGNKDVGSNGWTSEDVQAAKDTIGNYVLITGSRSYANFETKSKRYLNKKNLPQETLEVFQKPLFKKKDLEQRDQELKTRIINFYTKPK